MISSPRALPPCPPPTPPKPVDLCAFINGLPVATFELKNSLTKQTVADTVEQYHPDRDPTEKLFEFDKQSSKTSLSAASSPTESTI